MRPSPTRRRIGRAAGISALAAALTAVNAFAADRTVTGPASSASPYLVPTAAGVVTRSFLTVGDAANNGYELSGLPDGLGLIPVGSKQFRLLVNHEIEAGKGIARSHGGNGAFVSDWTLISRTGEVTKGADLISKLYLFDQGTGTYAVATGDAANRSRFCSATLAPASAFYDSKTKAGTTARLFTNGEETGLEGRAFAHIATGTNKGNSYDLPYLGKSGWENIVPNPATGVKTVAIGLDDSTPGQVYVYVGTKRKTGTEIERAGLTGGDLYGVKAPVATEDRDTGVGGAEVAFSLHKFGDVHDWTGQKLQDESVAAGVTEFLRPEDGAWDPVHPNNFYFVTTDRFQTDVQVGNSRLWRLRFTDRTKPELGGKLSMLLDGTEGPQMMDNLVVDRTGHVLIQEDPGNQAYLAKVWSYAIATDTVTPIAQADPRRFTPGASQFLTQDEESSGIIDAAEVLGRGWFILTAQAHYPIGGAYVEGGQLLAIYNPASNPKKGK